MHRVLFARFLVLTLALFAPLAQAQQNRDTNRTPVEVLASTMRKIVDMVDRPEDAPPKTFYATIEFRKAEGLSKWFTDLSAKIALQMPDRFWVSADAGDKSYSVGRDKQQLWMHSVGKEFGLVGEPGQARFASKPDELDETRLGPVALPFEREKLLLLPFIMNIEDKGFVELEDLRVRLLHISPKKEARETLKLPDLKLRLWLDTNDLPVRIAYATEAPKVDVSIFVNNLRLENPWLDQRWQLPKGKEDEVKQIAISHLSRFMETWASDFGRKIPALAKEDGKRNVLATEGEGRLERIDGMRVLFLKGTPEEMGRQHGVLLKKQIQDATERILYGLGVGHSFEKGKWFFGDIQSAQEKMQPFMRRDYLVEMDTMASAAGVNPVEIRLANQFLELFHCSGFVVYGKATVNGKMYHGRVLDYLRGAGLEQNAVLMVLEPEGRNAWLNVGYAGFVGSVTAMNEKHLAIGEMGGRHEEEWEGKPMAELVREVMEEASTLDEALEIMRKTPRTCEYTYVISDGNSKRAVAVRATPTKFEIIEAGKKHDRAPDPVEDAVIISADKRYEELVKRVKEKIGKIGSNEAWEFMKPPVAMDSNIQTVLFVPETLDFRVANADSEKVASEAPFRKYNLLKLLNRTVPVDQTVAK